MHKNKFDRNLVAIGIIAALCSTPALSRGAEVPWGNSVQYDNGLNPKAATDGSTVVEVHNAGYGVGPLWYRVGQANFSFKSIQWGNSVRYDYGMNPSVAISGSTVVEVHNAFAGVGPLWMRIGQVDTASNTIKWGNNNNAFQYDKGMNPSVAISGSNVVEVHNAFAGVGPLWYRIGQVNTSNNTIHWGNNNNAIQYEKNGLNPTVAITFSQSGLTPVEVHNGGYGVCPLWYHLSDYYTADTINWGVSAPYDNGMNPCVAGGVARPGLGIVIEVHNAFAGVGPLWYRVAYLQVIQ